VTFLCDFYNAFSLGGDWANPCAWTDPCYSALAGIGCFNSHVLTVGGFPFELDGTLPPSIAGLHNVMLINLTTPYSNWVYGTLPSSLTAWSALKALIIHDGELSGTLPALSLPSIMLLDLSNDYISGVIPSLNAVPSLMALELYDNIISGTIPPFSLVTAMRMIDLSNNYISGLIPALNVMPHLISLQLQENSLMGTIPAISTLVNLTAIDLSYNYLAGTMPAVPPMINASYCSIDYNCIDCSTVTTCACDYQESNCNASCVGNCYGHGQCFAGMCLCNSGWAAPYCNVSTFTPCPGNGNCNLHGTCDNSTGTCTCSSGWTAADCNTATCPGIPVCNNQGTCSGTTCTCNSGWTGADCSTPTSAGVSITPILFFLMAVVSFLALF
jgi:Leucine-rich repeat (LRR) protein